MHHVGVRNRVGAEDLRYRLAKSIRRGLTNVQVAV